MLEGSATSASNLEWFVNEFLQAQRQQARKEGRSVYDLCNDLVGATKAQDSGIIFLPFLYGSNVGLDGKACFIGLDGWQKRGHVLRAIYEGVVFSHLWHVRRLLKYRPAPTAIRLASGAARSDVWRKCSRMCWRRRSKCRPAANWARWAQRSARPWPAAYTHCGNRPSAPWSTSRVNTGRTSKRRRCIG